MATDRAVGLAQVHPGHAGDPQVDRVRRRARAVVDDERRRALRDLQHSRLRRADPEGGTVRKVWTVSPTRVFSLRHRPLTHDPQMIEFLLAGCWIRERAAAWLGMAELRHTSGGDAKAAKGVRMGAW